jgi:hypothetical protein
MKHWTEAHIRQLKDKGGIKKAAKPVTSANALTQQVLRVYSYYIGIDTGVNTGLCVWDSKRKSIFTLETLPIHKAMQEVKFHIDLFDAKNVFIRVEDARQRTWFGNTGKERLKGAGSVERDAKIWEDFLIDMGAQFEMVHPKNNKTKLTATVFNKIAGWNSRSSVHARDAAMLVIGH